MLFRSEKLNKVLRTSKEYNVITILSEMKGMGMLDEEILLYSRQKMHAEALGSLIELGKAKIDFTRAEEYCLAQSENLLDVLFREIWKLSNDAIKRYKSLDKDKAEYEKQKKYEESLEVYCKEFLKKYASNEKMNTESIFDILPDDLMLINIEGDQEDPSLLQYLESTFNSKLEQVSNYKIAKNVAEMHKLNLESDLAKLQRAYLIINPERKCRVCKKTLGGAKSFYVFPNGILTHSNCVKDVNICPVTNTNFQNKIYP